MNKLFKCTTDNEVFYVYAEDKYDAEALVVEEHFYEVLDDDLADLMDVEEVTKAGIIVSVDRDETIKEMFPGTLDQLNKLSL